MNLQQIAGLALTLLFLADIFLTVLYARAGTGLLAPHWNRAIWAILRRSAAPFGRRRGAVLSIAGPVIVVSLIGFWALGLTLGAALVIQPELGTAIRPSSGDTPTDFVTALLVGGNSLSIVGGSDFAPHTTGTKLLFLVNSLIGASVLSLVLSYLVQVYSGLRERNALALAIDLMTDGTGDTAMMLTRLLPDGDASDATSELGNLVRSLAATKEAHHFYPLLFYFRFSEPYYAVSRFCFILLYATTLIGTTLERRRYRSLAGSAPVAALRRGAHMLLETLAANFSTVGGGPDPTADAWRLRQHHSMAREALTRAGIATEPDSVDAYLAARLEWEPLVRRVAPTLGYAIDEIEITSKAGKHRSCSTKRIGCTRPVRTIVTAGAVRFVSQSAERRFRTRQKLRKLKVPTSTELNLSVCKLKGGWKNEVKSAPRGKTI